MAEGYSSTLLPAEQLLQSLQALTSMVKIYHANNKLLVNNMRQMVLSAEALLAGGGMAQIHLENGRFFVNDVKLLAARVWRIFSITFTPSCPTG